MTGFLRKKGCLVAHSAIVLACGDKLKAVCYTLCLNCYTRLLYIWDMKKQFNVRVGEETVITIKREAAEGGCSEGEVIEGWARGRKLAGCRSGKSALGVVEALKTGRAVFGAPPRRSYSKDELKTLIAGGGPPRDTGVAVMEPGDAPKFPFRAQVGDDVWLISKRGDRYFYGIENGGCCGFLEITQVTELWDKRLL